MAFTSILKTSPLLLSLKPRDTFSAGSGSGSVKFESFVNCTSISTGKNTAHGRPFYSEAHLKTLSSKGNTFEQTAVIPEEKDVSRTRVIKLQVGLHVRGPSFEESINRIAETADTSNSSETTEVLLNHLMSWIAFNSSVTILMAAKGKAVLNFPTTIDSNEDLMKAFKELQTISKSAEVQAVNVLWSPQDGNEVMSCEELYEEYPLLRRVGGNY